jgi:hypothetical protein
LCPSQFDFIESGWISQAFQTLSRIRPRGLIIL